MPKVDTNKLLNNNLTMVTINDLHKVTNNIIDLQEGIGSTQLC